MRKNLWAAASTQHIHLSIVVLDTIALEERNTTKKKQSTRKYMKQRVRHCGTGVVDCAGECMCACLCHSLAFTAREGELDGHCNGTVVAV